MLDPRIYRTGLIGIALAVIVFAFSLTNQQSAATTTLSSGAFSGGNAYARMRALANAYPSRAPGSHADGVLAGVVADALRGNGFVVSTQTAPAQTALGSRTLESVVGMRPGLNGSAIVIVSHRDALGSPATADLSGTAVMLELARVLAQETHSHSIVLASISGTAGGAGAGQLAHGLGVPVDAVISLGDLAGTRVREPIVVPWSDGQQLAPPLLRNTLAGALSSQAGLRVRGTSLGAQIARLAFPVTLSDQGPFNAAGEPAVLVSLAGERGPTANEPVGAPSQIAALGQGVLSAVNALDGVPSVPSPSAYLLYSGKVVPLWAVRLLVLALILPVLIAAVDGLARVRRRGHRVLRWLAWVLAGGVPFMLGLMLVHAAKLVGLIPIHPPAFLAAGVVPLHAAGVAVLVALALLIIGALLAKRPLLGALAGGRLGDPADPGAAAAVLLTMCALTLVIWQRNAFAAVLVVPALHLWLWVVDPGRRVPRAAKALLVLIGLAPPVLVVLYYAGSLGLGAGGIAWNGLLLFAGGQIGWLAGLEWCVLLGCVASVIAIAARPLPARERPEEAPITVRGPVTYAGPGSLGGTESALRR